MNLPALYAVRHFVKDWRSQIAIRAQQYPFPATSAGMLFVKKRRRKLRDRGARLVSEFESYNRAARRMKTQLRVRCTSGKP